MEIRYTLVANEQDFAVIRDFYQLMTKIKDECPRKADYQLHVSDMLDSLELFSRDVYLDLQNGEVSSDSVYDLVDESFEVDTPEEFTDKQARDQLIEYLMSMANHQ